MFRTGQTEPVKRVLKRSGEDAFIAGSRWYESIYEFLVSMRGSQQALLDFIDNPLLAHKIMELGTEISIQIGYALIEAGVDAIYIGETHGRPLLLYHHNSIKRVLSSIPQRLLKHFMKEVCLLTFIYVEIVCLYWNIWLKRE